MHVRCDKYYILIFHCSLLFEDLTIGFIPTSYATIEGVGLVIMNVAVLKGTIGTTVTLAVSTNDISSIGMT